MSGLFERFVRLIRRYLLHLDLAPTDAVRARGTGLRHTDSPHDNSPQRAVDFFDFAAN